MFISIDELSSHLRIESINAIIRNDPSLAIAAIDGAIAEAKSYLAGYNTNAIFSTTGDNRHPLLLIFIKDIAVWHLCNLVNPNINLQLRDERYKRAIRWLKDIQLNIVKPDLPLDNQNAFPNSIQFGYNPKNSYLW